MEPPNFPGYGTNFLPIKPTLEDLKKYSEANNTPLGDDEISEDPFFRAEEDDRKLTDRDKRTYEAMLGLHSKEETLVSADFLQKFKAERQNEIEEISLHMQKTRREEEEINQLLAQATKRKLI